MTRFIITQVETYVVDGEDAHAAFERLEEAEDGGAEFYEQRKVIVVDCDGNVHQVDY